jgi:sugar phosphate isomerase/epimerase
VRFGVRECRGPHGRGVQPSGLSRLDSRRAPGRAAAGPDRAGLLVDTWHFFSGDSTWEDLAEAPLEMIAHVQFDDALPRLSEDQMDETMNRRAMPGHGTFDLERFATTLLARGWSGLVSVEVLSRELARLPVAEFARLAYASSARYWL